MLAKSVLFSVLGFLAAKATADCSFVGGNSYCSSADAISYEGLGFSGSYQDVASIDETGCSCTQKAVSFEGTMSPLDEELSVHFRGPLKLAQFGVYYPDSSSSSKAKREAGHLHHMHKRASSDWTRSAYYTPGTGDGLTFLNHQGGTAGSGAWTSCFGNTLSYCASDGKSGAGSSEVLDDITVASNVEYLIMSDSECGASGPSGDCGVYRKGTPAFHGFGGTDKIFVFEFQMPTDSSATFNADMPAIWLLNAKIPRTLQYGNAECSCWSTGCGELDLFEILSSGSDKLISHLHDGQGSNGSSQGGGGSSDYFERPIESTMKAAAVFSDDNVYIVKLDNSTDFGSSLSADTVSSWTSAQASLAQISK